MVNIIQRTQASLQSQLESVAIPLSVLTDIKTKEIKKTARGAILELFGLGALENVLDTAERIEGATQEYKKGMLMEEYGRQVKINQDEVAKLKKFVTSPEGNIVFNKIIRILNNNPPIPYYAKLLATALRKIINSDFSNLFTKHVYVLNQIEKLTPQALIILVDCKNWPEYSIGAYASERGVITSEWIKSFLSSYAPVKKVADDSMIRRMGHALQELLRANLIVSRHAHATDSKGLGSLHDSTNPAKCEPTELGMEILEYVIIS